MKKVHLRLVRVRCKFGYNRRNKKYDLFLLKEVTRKACKKKNSIRFYLPFYEHNKMYH